MTADCETAGAPLLYKAAKRCYSKRQIYLPFTITASGGCERARKEISRFAARARRRVNVQNEIRFDVYDIYPTD